MTDYEQFLEENGLSKADMERAKSDVSFIPFDRFERELVRRGPSNIEGEGIFAVTRHRPSDATLIARRGETWTEVGRYMNHSANPNCTVEVDGDDLVFSPLWIHAGDELTVNYRDVKKAMREQITGGAALEPHQAGKGFHFQVYENHKSGGLR